MFLMLLWPIPETVEFKNSYKMAEIATPANAYKFSELTDAQVEIVRTYFGFGSFVKYFNTVKTGNDHAISTYKLRDGKTYLFRNNAIIENGDTITDMYQVAQAQDGYVVVVKGADFIPADGKCSLIIEGGTAIVGKA